MKEVYIAYFDFMGFKEFILNNENEVLIRRMGHIFRDIEVCLGQGKYQEPSNGVLLADISKSKLNCLNISDTVLFWTNGCDFEALQELLNVAYEFNWREIGYNFPLRGALVKGEIKEVSGKNTNSEGGSYSVQCLYGKGLVLAHDIAEAQEWAGTIIDKSIINDLKKEINGIEYLESLAVKYQVPFKNDENHEFYVFKLKKGIITDEALKNVLEAVEKVFSQDNKSIDKKSVQLKINNTKDFIINTKNTY
ncbi:hypothetical protein E6C50_08220 [Flavobacterium supellecticarium]|uniref:Guanylate cyclase domain-containing protein n=1 Tax=Flavobacterium supellecticarium TaxID=2565924 RepID=A0A4S4A0F8_9FLAO|nr:hypothetical protein [Flavobacterium supellecticarium]THF51735.1 hypothetical protein E6C50_08220 [Flavobacterium supellecticarium]